MTRLTIGRDTTLCISLSARPGTFGSRFHNHLYAALGLDWIYKALTTRDLPAAIGGVRALGVRGCAVSMPWKQACIPLLDALCPAAASIGAVNTIVNDDGRLTGHNTDHAAVLALLRERAIDPATPFALRGSGGMARAIAFALRDAGFRDGVVVARNRDAGEALARAGGFRAGELDGRERLLLNATPLGMRGPDADALAFGEDAIDRADVVIDAVASPPETPLVAAARAARREIIGSPAPRPPVRAPGALPCGHGASEHSCRELVTGADIIVRQAVDQFVLYTGLTPAPDQIAAAAAFALSS